MADETEDTTNEELEQPDEELEQEDLPDELPEDPVELKKIAESAISQVKSAKQKVAAVLSEKERLEDNLEEQRTKANFWSVKAQELEGQARVKQAPVETPSDDDAELADLVTAGMKLSDLKRMWQRDAEQLADRKATQIAQQGTYARRIVAEYPDLTSDNSPLTKATIAEMESVDQEMPGIADHAKFELAARRAADRLGISPRVTVDKETTERTRRRTAQGGPTGKVVSAKNTVVITDQERAMARKMNGGQDVPDKVLIDAKRRLIPDQARA